MDIKIIDSLVRWAPGLFFILSTIYFMYLSVTTNIEKMVTIPLKVFYLMWVLVFLAWIIGWTRDKYGK